MIAKRIIMVILAYILSGVVDIYPCLTTFINDKATRVIIYNKRDKTLIPVYKNEKRRFGNQHQHAHFAIYMQRPNKRVFSRTYICKQVACAHNGNIQLKLSDIENGSDVTRLFNITKSKPHSPMVQELPMIQQKLPQSPLHFNRGSR